MLADITFTVDGILDLIDCVVGFLFHNILLMVLMGCALGRDHRVFWDWLQPIYRKLW